MVLAILKYLFLMNSHEVFIFSKKILLSHFSKEEERNIEAVHAEI